MSSTCSTCKGKLPLEACFCPNCGTETCDKAPVIRTERSVQRDIIGFGVSLFGRGVYAYHIQRDDQFEFRVRGLWGLSDNSFGVTVTTTHESYTDSFGTVITLRCDSASAWTCCQ